MKNRKILHLVFIVLVVAIGFYHSQKKAEEIDETQLRPTQQNKIVNVYLSEIEEQNERIFDLFTRRTGIKVHAVTGVEPKLLSRLEYEGIYSPADVFIASDIGSLYEAVQKGILQPIGDNEIKLATSEQLRDDKLYWIGFTRRIRPVFYNKKNVSADQLSTYEDLADPKWKGKILTGSSLNIYNRSLIASVLYNNGLEKTEKWLSGMVANFAGKPEGNDMDQLKALAKGDGDIALANSVDYISLMMSEIPEDRLIASQIGVFFPNQGDRGVHVNISGGGITSSSMNRDNGIKLLEFMAGREAQEMYSRENYEYPTMNDVFIYDAVAGLGKFKEDSNSLKNFPELLHDAAVLAVKNGWM